MGLLFIIAIIIFFVITKECLLINGKDKMFFIVNILFVAILMIISLLIYYLSDISGGQKDVLEISLWTSAAYVFALIIGFIITILTNLKKLQKPQKPHNSPNLDPTPPRNTELLFSNNSTEPNVSLDEMKNGFFTLWELKYQCNSDQRIRLERAKAETIYRLLEINPNNGTALCRSSDFYKTGEVYEVTYKHCTCPDFRSRFRPCKHIYALNMYLGIIDRNEDLYAVSPETRQKLDSLPSDIAKYFLGILKKNKGKAMFLIKKSPSSKPLFELELVKEYSTVYLLDKLFTRNDLVAKIYEDKLNYQPSKKTTKEEIIAYIIENEPRFVKKIVKRDIAVTLDQEILTNQHDITNYLIEKCKSSD